MNVGIMYLWQQSDKQFCAWKKSVVLCASKLQNHWKRDDKECCL